MSKQSEAGTKQGDKQQNPIVPFLRLPEGTGGKAYLWGTKCKTCGAAYLGKRLACGKCFAVDNFDEIRFSDRGTLRMFTVVHMTSPGIKVPFVAAIVELPEGTGVRCNVEGVEPDGEKVAKLLGKELEMFTEKVQEDQEGNDVIAFKFRPVKA